jgi:membrane protein
MPIATLWHVTLRAVQHWWQDNCLRLAASLAYYTALSLAPLVLLIMGVIGLILNRQQVAQQLTAQLEGLMGPAGRELITSILTATSPQGVRSRPSWAWSRCSSAPLPSLASSRRR